MRSDKNLQLIQVLRGIASLLVVLFHATANYSDIFHTKFLFDFFQFGSAGVDIFFVISGFIITYTALQVLEYPKKLLSFLRRRAIRIYPTYWIIISLLLLSQVMLPHFFKTHYNFNLKNIAVTYLLFPAHTMVNGVSWTLSYELFFYFLFCFAFIIPNKKVACSLGLLYSFVIICLPIAGYDYPSESSWANLITFPMNVEFFMGVTVAVIITFFPKKLGLPFIIAGTFLFIIGAIISNINYQLVPNNFNRVILFGIPSFFIISGAVKYELTTKLQMPKLLLTIGEASYSLYLLHLPLIVASFRLIQKLNIRNYLILHIFIFLILSFILFSAIIFYKRVEKPLINRLNSIRRIKVANEI